MGKLGGVWEGQGHGRCFCRTDTGSARPGGGSRGRDEVSGTAGMDVAPQLHPHQAQFLEPQACGLPGPRVS